MPISKALVTLIA